MVVDGFCFLARFGCCSAESCSTMCEQTQNDRAAKKAAPPVKVRVCRLLQTGGGLAQIRFQSLPRVWVWFSEGDG